MKQAVYIEVRYDDGSSDVAEEESAAKIWSWLLSGESMNLIHGARYSGPKFKEIPPPGLEEEIAMTQQFVCTICGSPAKYCEDEQLWRHAGKPWEEPYMAQQFCDRYGYPIQVESLGLEKE